MKKVVLVCLLGMGLLCPVAKVNSSVVNQFVHRIVDVTLDGAVLYATSESADGPISKVEIHHQNPHEIVLTEYCSGYSCTVDLGTLKPGTYAAKVFYANGIYTEVFVLN